MIEDDPERCAYEALDEATERLVWQQFSSAFEREVARLGVAPEGIGLRSVSSSIERNGDGDRWLKFLATDGTTWYVGWGGDSADAVSIAEEFALTMAESVVS